ncbi:PREDICTED: LOW QUALITY PROTEIN: putative SEC14-like protein 6 [Lipotes vexillifer]|uniref:LOW QUALITY PROTEIN: putative SEC14-like protein 6 n=1 Tax=Lipotes vexillifer TaxID=118797 RepID=A0A340XPN2_LIPVE|nr:PREDICTED: LOW QUALITY PROTEIN: putative SEC14-like protein 6 [Lipotes vexillifer]
MSGQEGELSPSQETMLAQKSSEKSDDMLRKQVKFRKQQDLHNILAWQPPEVVTLYNANGTCGHDSEGRPTWYHIIRGLDLKGLLLSISRQELLRAKSQSCELFLRECASSGARLGKKVEKIIAVFDFEGLSQKHLWKPGGEFAQEFLTALEANYPEILRNIIVVRTSKLFPVAFNLIKPYITEEMLRKVVIPGDDWKQELPKFISPDQLPVEFGGTMTDTDGNSKCLSKINYGGEVPRSYYLRNQVRVQYKHQVTVGQGSSLQVENEILFPGCVLRWQFASDEVDIGFGVFLKTKMGERQRAGEMMKVLPSQRYNTHLLPEDGSLTCLQAGVYILCFDNTYSLMHAKRVSYTVEVLLPDKASKEKIQSLEATRQSPLQ